MNNFKLATERFYNSFAPFYLSMVIYLAAFLVGTLAWIGWAKAWNRAAFWLLMLGLTIQIGGLIARVIISGRPPVTNLYSSALFVSAIYVAAMLLVERITRIGLGIVLAAVGAFGSPDVGMDHVDRRWRYVFRVGRGTGYAVLAFNTRDLHHDRLRGNFCGRIPWSRLCLGRFGHAGIA